MSNNDYTTQESTSQSNSGRKTLDNIAWLLQEECGRRIAGAAYQYPLEILNMLNGCQADDLIDRTVISFIKRLGDLRAELEEVENTAELATQAAGDDLPVIVKWWTRYCFKDPDPDITDYLFAKADGDVLLAASMALEMIGSLAITRKTVLSIPDLYKNLMYYVTSQEAEKKRLLSWSELDTMIGPIEWEWKSWLPRGLLCILAGESGTGKSALALMLANCFISGKAWPDGSPYGGDPGAVLWCEAEAAQAINLDRAKAWGIPLQRLKLPLANLLEDFKLDRADHKGALVEAAQRPEIRFIAIDSLSGADSKSEKSVEDSSNVKWLAELARDTNKPILLTHHLRKRGLLDSEVVTLDRLRGSSAIVQPARIIWALDVPDPSDKDTKRLQVVKSNLARFPEPVGMVWKDDVLRWTAAPEVPHIETVAEKAMDLLRALLENKPQPYEKVEQEFHAAGISYATLKRAKAKLGVVSSKNQDGWFWGLPEKNDTSLN